MRHRLSKRPRRGMTVFVVLLVIAMLGALGLFAARSSQLGVTNAGRYRQMVQTHYIAEAGLQGAVSEIDLDPGGNLDRLHGSTPPRVVTAGQYPCKEIPWSPTSATFKPASTQCLRVGLDSIQASARTRSGVPTLEVFEKKGALGTGESRPGSFGMANIAGNFVVEITDERPVIPPPPGMPIGGGGGSTMRFKAISARSTGQIIPTDDAGNVLPPTSDTYKYATSIEVIRAEIIVGPVP
ncbi:MAG: hypothetical protein HOW73_25140 [Polyangiaceae bacterium]|nr:hypothetical protein [Polyangiaceae bacterium]